MPSRPVTSTSRRTSRAHVVGAFEETRLVAGAQVGELGPVRARSTTPRPPKNSPTSGPPWSNSGRVGRPARPRASRRTTEVMLAGGSGKHDLRFGRRRFAAMRALSTRNDAPEKASRPWDKDRDGFVLGEGAAILCIELLEHAVKSVAPKFFAKSLVMEFLRMPIT